MGWKIGWFILGYLVFGKIIDIALTYALFFIAAYRDEKARKSKTNSNPGHLSNVSNAFNDAETLVDEAFPSDDHHTSMVAAIIFGWVLWPITVPVGLHDMWSRMNS